MAKISEKSPAERAELAAFSANLVRLMAEKSMSQSDLARAIWGHKTDARGRNVATNRDWISLYINRKVMPERDTIKKLASALGVPPAELHPPLARTAPGARPAMSMTSVGGRSDLSLLEINRIVPTNIAVQILGLLAQAPEGAEAAA